MMRRKYFSQIFRSPRNMLKAKKNLFILTKRDL